MKSRSWTPAIAVIAILSGLALGAASAWFGDLNQDEGWYLYAARSVSEGRYPYRDFAFTQGPMLPLVYALAAPLVESFGVLGGRLFTLILGWIALGCGVALAGRLVEVRHAATARTAALVLGGICVYHAYFTAIVKTYSLCAVFLVAAFLALSFVRRNSLLPAALAGLLLALAAGTRISSGAALAITGLVLLFHRRTLGDRPWLAFGIGGAGGLAAVMLPWLVLAPEGFRFGVFEYHTLRSAGSLLQALVFKAGCISRLVQGYLVAAIVAVGLVLWHMLNRSPDAPRASDPVSKAAWFSLGTLLLIHLSAPFPYDDYQVPLFPLFAAVLSAAVIRVAGRSGDDVAVHRNTTWLQATLLLACLAQAGASPMLMDWFVRGRDRIWWRLKDVAPIAQLHRVALDLRAIEPGAHDVLTQDTYLAVEAGLHVPPGMEMGPFSYFPEFTDERAAALHVLNRSGLRKVLDEAAAPLAAFSDYGLCVACPEVSELSREEQLELRARLHQRYALVGVEPFFGQGGTTLRLYKRAAGAQP